MNENEIQIQRWLLGRKKWLKIGNNKPNGEGKDVRKKGNQVKRWQRGYE